MGIFFSRKKESISLPDFKAMLEKINKSMADHQAQRDRLIAMRRKILWRLWLVTFFLVILATGFAYLGFVAKKPLFLLPPFVIPIIAYLIHKIVSFIYNRRTKRVEKEQEELIAQIEEVRKITKLGEVSELFNPTPRPTPASRPQATPHTQGPPVRTASQTPYATHTPTQVQTHRPAVSTPFIPPSTPNATPKYIAVPPSATRPVPANSNLSVQPPPSASKSKPGVVGWVLGMVVGDDDSVPVKCVECKAVNCYVSKNEAASAQFKCAICGRLNGVEESVKDEKPEVKEKKTKTKKSKSKEVSKTAEEVKEIQRELEEDDQVGEHPIVLIQEQEQVVVEDHEEEEEEKKNQ